MEAKNQIQEAIYETIPDINQWQNVLDIFIKVTGATKGIISLRHRLTAELVIPADVRQELSSPVVNGFSDEEIHSYITHYKKFDTWTKIENLYHPYKPYSLSDYISLDDLKKKPFWKWLEPQNISDTSILKLGDSSPKYWVAMNLYYPSEETELRKNIHRYILELQRTIQHAWKLGQIVRLSNIKSGNIEFFLEQHRQPAFLIRSDRDILLQNKKADKIIADKDEFILKNKTLYSNNTMLIEQLDDAIHALKNSNIAKKTTEQKEVVLGNIILKISLIGNAESLFGENTAFYLLTIQKFADQYIVWEHPSLTQREKQLVEILAKGGRVVDFQKHSKLAKSTAHKHWQSVKKKLNVTDRTEIHASHQVFLKTNN